MDERRFDALDSIYANLVDRGHRKLDRIPEEHRSHVAEILDMRRSMQRQEAEAVANQYGMR